MTKRAASLGLTLALGSVLAMAGAAAWCATARAADGTVVTVELFTSQGCASCPAADAFLSELAQRPNVIALSLPIDYWDYLGWRDTLAIPENAKRQYAYAEKLDTQRPYTPQVVVDGRYDCVGSDKSEINSAIKRFSKGKEIRIPVEIARSAGLVTVSVGAPPADGKPIKPATRATVWLIRYEPVHQVPVEKGENEGRTLTYTNVVRSWSPLGMWEGAPVRFRLSERDLGGENSGYVVLVQQDGTGPILGAARFPAIAPGG